MTKGDCFDSEYLVVIKVKEDMRTNKIRFIGCAACNTVIAERTKAQA